LKSFGLTRLAPFAALSVTGFSITYFYANRFAKALGEKVDEVITNDNGESDSLDDSGERILIDLAGDLTEDSLKGACFSWKYLRSYLVLQAITKFVRPPQGPQLPLQAPPMRKQQILSFSGAGMLFLFESYFGVAEAIADYKFCESLAAHYRNLVTSRLEKALSELTTCYF